MTLAPNQAYAWTGQVLNALRGALHDAGFAEILPAILSKRFEPGARHSLAVLGDRALPTVRSIADDQGRPTVSAIGADYYYLPVSHCVEKQLALEFAERVYCVAPCLRLLMDGEHESGRHLYTFFQVEIEWRTESVDDVLTTIERVLATMAETILTRPSQELTMDKDAIGRIAALGRRPFVRLPFSDARDRVRGAGGSVNPHAVGDLTHAEENALSHEFDAPFWLTDYPEGVRDSLYRRNGSGTFATYDLVLPGGYGEVATGGLRSHSGDDIRQQARNLGPVVHDQYAAWKDRTALQTGGLGFGLERLIRYCAGRSDILELRFAHDQGPNATIDEGQRLCA
jgi:asparaginyl-tRNA synthetase